MTWEAVTGMPGIPGQFVRHGGPGFGVARIVHVAVHAGQRMLRQGQKLAVEGFGRVHIRVSQGEVVDVVGTVFPAQDISFLEHLANPG